MKNSAALNPRRLALIMMLGCTIAIAIMHSSVRVLSDELHPIVIVFFRNLFGLLVILPLIARAGISSLKTDHSGLYVLRALVGVLAMSSWFYALSKVPLTNATALSFSTTIFATLTAWYFLKEKMRIRRWAAIVVGLLGVIVVLRPDMDGFNLYSLLVLGSTVAWGASVTIVKQLSKTDSVVAIIGWMGISLTALSFVPALFYWQTPSLKQLLILAVIGSLATAGHWLMTSALKLADTAVVMSMDFMRLIWTAIIGAIFFSEILDVWTAVGAAIIFSAGWYIIFRESKILPGKPKQIDVPG